MTDATEPKRVGSGLLGALLAGGLLVGLLAGIFLAALRERLDDSIRDESGLADLGLPVLAGVTPAPAGPTDGSC